MTNKTNNSPLSNGAQAGKQKVDTDKVLIKLPSHEQSVAELGVSASSPDFNLSDRIGFFNQGYIILRKEGVEWIHKEDVKEFIKRLKEYMRCYCSMASNEEAWKFFSDEIDNLAGDKLT